jgi:hypothetical protein
VLTEKWPVLGRHEQAAVWLTIWTDLGRARRTIDAYARGLAEYLLVCEREGVAPLTANRAHIAVFVRELTSQPSRRGACAGSHRGWRRGGVPVTVPVSRLAMSDHPGRWRWPIDPRRYDTARAVSVAEKEAIAELGVDNLRRLARHDPTAPGWRVIRRLLRPLDDAAAALDSPPTTHHRRAVLDATAVVLLRCGETGRSYWSWTDEEWANLLGHDQFGFGKSAPTWADDAVRPYLAAHAFLLGGFTAFYRLGSFSRLTLAWRIFGRDRVDGEIRRIRSVLAGWGYRLGRDDDTLLPMVACQVFLLNRSPHVEELSTELFERIRGERLLPELRLNTLHAMQRAVAELGHLRAAAADDGPPLGAGQRRAAGVGSVGGALV